MTKLRTTKMREKLHPKSHNGLTDNQLRAVQRYARQVRKENPDLKWSQCVARGYRRFNENRPHKKK